MSLSTRFIHLGDSHLGPLQSSELHGVNTFAHSVAVANKISMLVQQGVPIDFVVHTGDMLNDGDRIDSDAVLNRSIISDVWSGLPVPLYIINGNHDDIHQLSALPTPQPTSPPKALPKASPTAGVTAFTPITGDSHSRAGYFQSGDHHFFCFDARPPLDAGIDPQGKIPQAQLDSLEQLLIASETKHVCVFLHYPPLPLDCEWKDRTMLVRNGADLHDLLKRFRHKIAGCFYGHVHQGATLNHDGLLYSSVAAISGQFSSWPNSSEPIIDSRPLAHFNYVSVTGTSATIKQHVIMV